MFQTGQNIFQQNLCHLQRHLVEFTHLWDSYAQLIMKGSEILMKGGFQQTKKKNSNHQPRGEKN